MKQTILSQISESIETLVKEAAPRLVHIGGEGIPHRTGIKLDNGYIATTAGSAEEGEKVTVLLPDSTTSEATVKAFDGRTGIVLLHTGETAEIAGWEAENPRLGMLAITVAFASPEGKEARLDMVRCVGEDYFQTDGPAFPGFSGGAVLSPEGAIIGIVTSNSTGNRGQMLPYKLLLKLVEILKTHGSSKRRVLGVRTQPVKDGLLVVEVVPGSASEGAGILVGDLLIALNKVGLAGPLSLAQALADSTGEVELSISRGGKTQNVKVTPGEQTETFSRQWKHHG